MSDTPRLGLPLMAESQAGKYQTYNDLALTLDVLASCSVLDRDLTAPPGSPAEGDCYLVATGGTGDWSGHDGDLAAYQGGAWRFYPPPTQYWVTDEAVWAVTPV
jgi:hypothetical protein